MADDGPGVGRARWDIRQPELFKSVAVVMRVVVLARPVLDHLDGAVRDHCQRDLRRQWSQCSHARHVVKKAESP